MKSFLERANELTPQLLKDRRFLHENAEAGMLLPVTTKYVMKRLREIGLEPTEICPSGIVAVIEGAKPGKTILLRADMDALPMEEHNELPFHTQTTAAHTCGHDMHTSMLLTAAQMLVEHKDELCGRVKLMFQPGEEVFGGSKQMIASGLMDTPQVDAALGIHMMLDDGPGTICYGSGYMTSSCDGFKVTVKGKGCHGAMPHTGVDPINVGTHIYLALQSLMAREVPPMEAAVLTFGSFTSGSTSNIIPETAILQGTLRTYNADLRKTLVRRIHEITEQTAKMFGAAVEYEELSSVPSAYTDPDMLEDVIGYIDRLNGDFQKIPNYRVTPSDDFAFVTEKVPTVYLMLCAKTEGNSFQHHNPGVLFHEDAMPIGAAIHAQCAMEWLDNHK